VSKSFNAAKIRKLTNTLCAKYFSEVLTQLFMSFPTLSHLLLSPSHFSHLVAFSQSFIIVKQHKKIT